MIPGEFFQSSCFDILRVPSANSTESTFWIALLFQSFVVSFGWATMLGAFEENSWISEVFRTPFRNGIAFLFVMGLYCLYLTLTYFLNIGTVFNLTIFTLLGLILKLVPTLFSFISVFKHNSKKNVSVGYV